MHILIVGGSGFIGSNVVRQLMEGGHAMTVFHRGRASVPGGAREILGDRKRLRASAAAIRAVGADVVIDMALSSGAQARDLVSVLRGAAGRVVAISSCDVYRACGLLHGLETGPLEPMPLVETSRLRTRAETYRPEALRRLQQVFGWLDEDYDKIPVEREVLTDRELPGTVLRLPMVYGPGDRLHRLFPLIKRMDDGRRAVLFEEKHGAWRGPRGYVENVAAAIVLAATDDRAAGRIYNVAEADDVTEIEWARAIADVIGWNGAVVSLPAERMPVPLRMPGNLDQHWVVDSTRIRAELGYRETVSRTEALRRTIEWERANPPGPGAVVLDYAAEDAAIRAHTAAHARANAPIT